MEKIKTLTIGNSTFDIHDDEAVRFIAQELTEEQKEQVRTNIGALTTNDLNKFSSDKADIIQSASGEVITIDNAAYTPIQGLKLFGKTTQNGTPTPEAPVPLVSAGDGGSLGVTVAGKNLIPYPYIDTTKTVNGITFTDNGDGSITVNGTSTSEARFIVAQNIAVNGAVALSGCPAGGASWTYSMQPKVDNQWVESTFDIGAGSRFNVQAEITTLYIIITSGRTVNNLTFKPQLEIGSTITEYELYKRRQSLTLSTPNGLPGIPVSSGGNYTDETGQQWICDEVDFGRGVYVQRVLKKPITDYSNPITFYNWEQGFTEGSVVLPTSRVKTNIGLSSHFILSSSGASVRFALGNNSTNATAWFVISGTLTKAEWQAKMTELSPSVLVALETPIETALSAEELAAYAVLHTNYHNTTILNDGGAGMEVQYYTPTTAVQMVHSPADEGKILSIDKHGCVVKSTIVPTVTASDNGKFMRVIDGKWAAIAISSAEDGEF